MVQILAQPLSSFVTLSQVPSAAMRLQRGLTLAPWPGGDCGSNQLPDDAQVADHILSSKLSDAQEPSLLEKMPEGCIHPAGEQAHRTVRSTLTRALWVVTVPH